MPVVHLPRSLVAMFPGVERRVEVEGASVGAVVESLERRAPGLRDRICAAGAIREHVNVFVDGERSTLATPVAPDSVIHVIPAVSGGC